AGDPPERERPAALRRRRAAEHVSPANLPSRGHRPLLTVRRPRRPPAPWLLAADSPPPALPMPLRPLPPRRPAAARSHAARAAILLPPGAAHDHGCGASEPAPAAARRSLPLGASRLDG